MGFEHALRSHVTSIWKTLTSGGWQRAWRSLPWKSSTHFIKWPQSNTCLSTNNALIHENGKRRHKGSYSWDRTPLQHTPWKMTYFLKSSRNIIRQWVTIQVVNDEYIIFCSHTRYPQSLSQLRRKTHLTNHHHTLGCGCSRTPASLLMGAAMRGGEARKSEITLPATCAPPCSHHKTKAPVHGWQESGVGWGCDACHTTKSPHWIRMINAPVTWCNHPRHARHGVINHCNVNLPGNACNYLPWAATLVKSLGEF